MRALGCLAVLLLSTGVVHAQADRAAADDLFKQGRAAMKAGDYATACARFEASNRLDPGYGTLLNLGECYQHLDKVTSARAAYNDAADIARKNGELDRAKSASAKADALESRVSRLKVDLGANAKLENVSVRRDGKPIDPTLFGTEVATDAGDVEVTVEAPGYKRWSTKTKIVEGKSATVVVPPLEAAPEAPKPRGGTGAAAPENPGQTRRTIGLVVGGAGLAAALLGGYFGIAASSAWSDAEAACPTHMSCSPQAISLHDDASSKALLSTVFVGVGVAAIATGVVLFVTAPRGEAASREQAWRVTPTFGTWGIAVSKGF